jgi:hypothetical protein
MIARILLLLLYAPCLMAQDSVASGSLMQLVFKGNHVSVGASFFLTSRAHTEAITGSYPFGSSSMPGACISVDYHINYGRTYSLQPGIGLVLPGRNFELNVYKNDFSPPLKQDYHFKAGSTRVNDNIVYLQLLLQRRFFYREHSFIHTKAGMRLNYSLGADGEFNQVIVENEDDVRLQAAMLNANANNKGKPWLSGELSAGHGWIIANNNILDLSIVSNISFTNYISGIYVVNGSAGVLAQGLYRARGSYVGIFLGYIFTNANYRLQKKIQP